VRACVCARARATYAVLNNGY